MATVPVEKVLNNIASSSKHNGKTLEKTLKGRLTKGKDRKANWSSDEILTMVTGIGCNYDKLVGKFSSTISLQLKNRLWGEVSDSVIK